jgi:hypothetical protein
MQTRDLFNVPAQLHRLSLILWVIFALWVFSALFRIGWVMPSPSGDIIVGVLVISGLSFIVWGCVQKVRTGRLPTKEEEQAVLSKVGGRFWSIVGAGFSAACISSFILLVEFNETFSRQAVERVAGEHPTIFWVIVGTTAFIGACGQFWANATPTRTPNCTEAANTREGGSTEAKSLTSG